MSSPIAIPSSSSAPCKQLRHALNSVQSPERQHPHSFHTTYSSSMMNPTINTSPPASSSSSSVTAPLRLLTPPPFAPPVEGLPPLPAPLPSSPLKPPPMPTASTSWKSTSWVPRWRLHSSASSSGTSRRSSSGCSRAQSTLDAARLISRPLSVASTHPLVGSTMAASAPAAVRLQSPHAAAVSAATATGHGFASQRTTAATEGEEEFVQIPAERVLDVMSRTELIQLLQSMLLQSSSVDPNGGSTMSTPSSTSTTTPSTTTTTPACLGDPTAAFMEGIRLYADRVLEVQSLLEVQDDDVPPEVESFSFQFHSVGRQEEKVTEEEDRMTEGIISTTSDHRMKATDNTNTATTPNACRDTPTTRQRTRSAHLKELIWKANELRQDKHVRQLLSSATTGSSIESPTEMTAAEILPLVDEGMLQAKALGRLCQTSEVPSPPKTPPPVSEGGGDMSRSSSGRSKIAEATSSFNRVTTETATETGWCQKTFTTTTTTATAAAAAPSSTTATTNITTPITSTTTPISTTITPITSTTPFTTATTARISTIDPPAPITTTTTHRPTPLSLSQSLPATTALLNPVVTTPQGDLSDALSALELYLVHHARFPILARYAPDLYTDPSLLRFQDTAPSVLQGCPGTPSTGGITEWDRSLMNYTVPVTVTGTSGYDELERDVFVSVKCRRTGRVGVCGLRRLVVVTSSLWNKRVLKKVQTTIEGLHAL